MLIKIKKLLWPLFQLLRIDSLYLLYKKSYLKEVGWFKSYRKKESIDKNGQPIPWLTYSCIAFLEERLNENMEIFEYGSGNSTLWFANKCKNVTSVEYDKNWYEKIKKIAPKNTNILFERKETNNYIKSISSTNKKYDVIIIDGRNRGKCMKESINHLKDNGIIILDDSERQIYQNGIKFLKNNNFKEITFTGMGPINIYGWTTSIFNKYD
ncbi:FkbM family methyltransferase [bacterium]|nr:FkbM family methyltransferase [bacterium]